MEIKRRIGEAALRAGHDPSVITLIAVTKYVDAGRINEAIRAGVTDIGENRIQDALVKLPLLEGKPVKHLIGSLQTNKTKQALAEFDLIHSVDRLPLVVELAKQAEKMNKRAEILIQLNISREVSKHGLHPEQLPELLEVIKTYPVLIPRGLMTIAPLVPDPELARPIFRRLREVFLESAARFDLGANWRYLSMGMSQDYEVAVEEGANLVRIGSALFAG